MLSAECCYSKSDAHSQGSDNPSALACLSDQGYSDYPNSLSFLCFFVALVQLVAAVTWTFQIYSISAFSLRLDISTVNWTPGLDGELDASSRRCIGHHASTVHWIFRLDGALDVSDIAWTLSKGPNESYRYALANSLVSLITLSLNH